MSRFDKIPTKVLLIIVFILLTGIVFFAKIRSDKAKTVRAQWFNSSWVYRKELVFNNSSQAENLQDFPVLIKLDNTNFDFSQAQNQGQDIRFTDSNGTTLLPYEIESYDSSAETATIWVNVPQIDSSSATDHIYLYWGNSGASDNQDSESTWNPNYKGVWHLGDNASNTTVTDSSGNDNHLTSGQITANFTSSGHIDSSYLTMGTPQVVPNQPGSYSAMYPSLKLDANNYPIIAYYDDQQDDLILVHCNDTSCKGDNESVVVVDSTGNVGLYPSIQLDSSGFPMIAYYDATNTALKYTHCGNANCSAGNVTNQVDNAASVGSFPILQKDGSGNPVIAYYDASNTSVKLAHCNDANCDGTGESIVTVDNTEADGLNFHGTSMVLDTSGNPVLSYYDDTNDDLKLTHCGDANCSAGNTTVRVVETGNIGQYTSLQLDSSGYPMIAYYNVTNTQLEYVHCSDVNCSTPPTPIVLQTGTALYPQMQLTDAGIPIIIASLNYSPRLLVCSDANCTTDSENYLALYNQYGCLYPTMELDSNDYPVIVDYNYGRVGTYDVQIYRLNPKLKRDYDPDFDFGTSSFSASMWFKSDEASLVSLLTRYDSDQGYKVWLDYGGHACFGIDDDATWGPDDFACTNPSDTVTNVDTGSAGDPNGSSLQLDASGYPVIAYYDDTPDDLEFIHCTDANCSGTPNKAVIDTTGSVGLTPSMQLIGGTTPVIAYHDNTTQKLKVALCGDANCSSGNTVNTIGDTTANVGDYPSLQLDANNYPVIAYYDTTNTAIKLVHCNDTSCSGDDETIVTVDNTEVDIPYYAYGDWMVLDDNYYPVMAYFNDTADDLKLARCNDIYCNDVTLVTLDTVGNVGRYAALELDASDNPVIAYYDGTNFNLKLIHCDDAYCSSKSTNNVKSGENGEQGAWSIKLEITADGNPMILHGSQTRYDNVLTLCNDPDCAGSDESFTYIRDDNLEYMYHNLQLDTSGYPVVLYANGSDLNLLHATSEIYTDTNAYDDGSWHHLVAVKNSTSDIRLYIDGSEVASDVATIADATLTSDSAEFRLAENIVNIGGTNYSVDNWNGNIDEVQIDNTARSAAWVAAQYLSESGTFVSFGQPQTDPVAYWKFDEGVGSTAYDSATNTHSGTLLGTTLPTWASEDQCISGKCLSFDNGTNRVDMGSSSNNALNFGTGDFSVGVWFKTTNLNTGSCLPHPLVNKGINTSSGYGIGIDGGTMRFWVNSTTIAYTYPNDSQWHYIVGVRTQDSIYVYDNGVLKNQKSSSPTNINTASTFSVGRNYCAGGIDGFIDEVKVYDYARSTDQIKSDYVAGSSIKGSSAVFGHQPETAVTPLVSKLVAYYKFDEGYGTTANNSGSAGSSFNGTLSGTTKPEWTNNGRTGKALSFDTNKYVEITDSTSSPLDLISEGSLTMWVKLDSYNILTGFITKCTSASWTACNYGLIMRGEWAGEKKILANIGDGSNYEYASSRDLDLNTWYHITMTWDGSLIKIYTNGVLDDTEVQSYTPQLDNDPLRIGVWGAAGNAFNGDLDEVKIYNYALSEDEVKLDYNQGKTAVLGSLSSGTGSTASINSDSTKYCLPGDTSPCSPPVADWKFDKIDSTYAFDTSSNNNTGTLQNSPNWIIGHNSSGNALNFNASGKRVTLANPINNTGQITASIWHKRDDTSASSSWRTLFGHATANVHHLIIRDTTRNLGIYDTSWRDFGYNVANDSKWHNFTVIYDVGTSATLYVDGHYQNKIYTSLDFSANPLGSIGNWNSNNYWAGPIDDVRIYDYARTPAQIAWDYNRGAPVAWWKFDKNQGTIAYDSIGSNHGSFGTGDSAPTWTTGKINTALSFDGNDYVSVGDIGTSATSLSFWIKPSSTTQSLIELSASDSIAISSGTVSVTGFGTETIYVDSQLSSSVPDTNWHHLTIISSVSIPTNTINIGKISSTYYSGLIDDVRIYNYALTGNQIKQIHNNGAVSFN